MEAVGVDPGRDSSAVKAAVVAVVVGAAMVGSTAQAAPGDLTRVSVATDGTQGEASSYGSTVTADGRFVAFGSASSTLVPGDDNAQWDVFVRDVLQGTTSRISVATDGAQGNGISERPAITPDGRYVAFASLASTLVPGDTNDQWDVFVRDLQQNTTTLASVATDGTLGDGSSLDASISADGRYVGFGSTASNLVAGDTNGAQDVFVRDLQQNTTTLASVALDGAPGVWESRFPSIAAGGRYVAFASSVSTLVPGDTNLTEDVFVRDLEQGTTSLVSVAADGGGAMGGQSIYPSISANGRYVAFQSYASNLVPGGSPGRGVFVRDLQTATTTLASVFPVDPDGQEMDSSSPSISADGRHVAFVSRGAPGGNAYNLDVFVRDLQARTTTVVTHGTPGDYSAEAPSLSADGRYVTFSSTWPDLVPGDTNGTRDVFLRDRGPQRPPRTSVTLTPTADTYVNEQAKSTNYGRGTRLAVQGVPRKQYLSYLRFSLPAAPTGTALTGASLRIFTAGESFAGSTTSQPVRMVAGPWTEGGTTFTTRPGLGAQLGTVSGARRNATAYRVALDITAVGARLGGNLDIAVTGTTVDDALWFRSREAANPSYRPQLTLTFAP